MALVTAHEFGHFICARRNGVRVLEFGICFPPRAVAWVRDPKTKKWRRLPKSEWDKPQDGLIFSLNCLPIGGFCQMDGETDADTTPGTFGAAKYWSKTKILFGGVATNWLIAFVILTVLAWTGMPTFLDNQFEIASDLHITSSEVYVSAVAADSPAEAAGFQEGDQLLTVAGTAVTSASDIINYNNNRAGETVTYTVRRDNIICKDDETPENAAEIVAAVDPDAACINQPETLDLTATLNPSDDGYLLGITMTSSGLARYTWSAPLVAAGTTVQLTAETFKGVGTLLVNLVTGLVQQLSPNSETRETARAELKTVSDSVAGPVGIIGQLFPAYTATGATNVAFLAAVISISLACMNVLPIPALDGGRWLLITIFKLRKKPLTKEIEEKIVSRAFTVLILLILVITVMDVIKLF